MPDGNSRCVASWAEAMAAARGVQVAAAASPAVPKPWQTVAANGARCRDTEHCDVDPNDGWGDYCHGFAETGREPPGPAAAAATIGTVPSAPEEVR